MATTPITGVTLPNTTSTDQVPTDLMAAFTAAEKMWVGTYASASARDTKITTPTGGMVAFISSPGKFTYYDATLGAWADLMNPTAWTSFTPTLQTPGGTAQNLGSGATQIGRYQQLGKTVNFQCQWNFGSSITGPSGQLVFLLPPGLPAANVAGLGQMGLCSLVMPNQNWFFGGYWTVNPAGTYAMPHFPLGSTTAAMGYMSNPSNSDGTGGVPIITGTGFNYPLQPGGTLTAAGTYQIA